MGWGGGWGVFTTARDNAEERQLGVAGVGRGNPSAGYGSLPFDGVNPVFLQRSRIKS